MWTLCSIDTKYSTGFFDIIFIKTGEHLVYSVQEKIQKRFFGVLESNMKAGSIVEESPVMQELGGMYRCIVINNYSIITVYCRDIW
jgi:hypothetical protein